MGKYTINDNFIGLRKRLKLTQDEFSKALGIKRNTLAFYEEQRAVMPYDLVKKILDIGFISKNSLYDFMFSKKF